MKKPGSRSALENGLPIGKPGRLDRVPTNEEKWRAQELVNGYLMPALECKDYRRAVTAAYRALKLVPRDQSVWGLLLQTLLDAEVSPGSLLEVARQAVTANPRFEFAYRVRVNAAYNLRDAAEIVESIEAFLRRFGGKLSSKERGEAEEDLAEARRRLLEREAFAALAVQTRQTRRRQQSGPGSRSARIQGRARARTAGKKKAALERSNDRGAGNGERPRESAAGSPQPEATRLLEVPVASPRGAAAQVEIDSLQGLARRLLDGERSGVEAVELALAAADALSADHFDRLLALERASGVERFPHQIETVLRVLKRFHGRVLLADEVGLGKTIEAALVLSEYLIRGQVRRALILCPPALVAQWRAEIGEKFALDSRTTLDKEFKCDPQQFLQSPGILIVSLAAARLARNREILTSQRFDLVIADEAHHLKNRSARGWELVNSLRSRFLLMLTATPVETNLTELYNLVTLLRPGTLGTAAEFRRRFQRGGDPLLPRQPDQLRDLLREVMIRNTRAQSGVALPPRVARTVVVQPSAAEKRLYAELLALARAAGPRQRTLCRLLLEEAGSCAPAAAATAAAGAASVAAELRGPLGRAAESARAIERPAKLDRLVELLQGDKVLVFTRFLAAHRVIAAELERRGIPYVSFTGDMRAEQRLDAVAGFRDRTDIMLCSEVGGEGQNLQFCHRLINFDLPWNPMVIEQRIGRLHRIGQGETVEIVNLCTADTAEERILDVLDRRVNMFELVVGEMDMLLGKLEDEREFGDRVYDIYSTSRTREEVERGFASLGELLAGARRRLDRVRQTEEALFGQDLGA